MDEAGEKEAGRKGPFRCSRAARDDESTRPGQVSDGPNEWNLLQREARI